MWHPATHITNLRYANITRTPGWGRKTCGTCLAKSRSMTIIAELVLVASSVGSSMALSRVALGQLFVLVQMGQRQPPDVG